MQRAWVLGAVCAALAGPAAADAVGPSVVAKADLSLWAEPLDSRAGFDKASRAATLVYVGALAEMHKLSDAEMLVAFKIKSINRASVDKWLGKELAQSAANYRAAAAACAGASADWTCVEPPAASGLVAAATSWASSVPVASQPWRSHLAGFARSYVAEQLRLAALFPKTSSEIDVFGEGEWTGESLDDAHFQLSFDDGPTAVGGSTDETLRMLASQGRNGIFFMLGENLSRRAKAMDGAALAQTYSGQCVASHGWEHQSHARWDAWQDSVKRTQALLLSSFPKAAVLPYFRPPYGQRTADSGAFFREQGLQVALWNLDSQDWNSRVSAADIVDRMVTLMLIKRRGMLLFHDVHPKAKLALPVIFAKLGRAVTWRDCHAPIR